MSTQILQREWNYLWTTLKDQDEWLFKAWIHPNKLEDFSGKTVMDGGCGPGHHVRTASRYAQRVVGVDLNTTEIARSKLADLTNVELCQGDLATWDTGERFDVIYSVGVVHHTQDPDRTVKHLKELVKPGGRVIFWVYSREGNGFVYWILEPLKKMLLDYLPRWVVLGLSHLLTLSLYPIIHVLYRLPGMKYMPYCDYFDNIRGSTYQRKLLNVFDKLNAPTTHLITEAQARRWMQDFENVHVDFYVGTSWRVSGTKPS